MIIYLLLFIIGLVFGSFYLVVATRMPNEESLVLSRSHCDNCKHVLKWYELIPLVSYIIQKGKCRKCGSKISILAPFTEILTAICFCIPYFLYGFGYLYFTLVVLFSLMIIIYVSDFKFFIINDSPLFISILIILCLKFYYFGLKSCGLALLSGAIMFIVFMMVKLFGDKVFKKESLGGGDIKLAILIGVVLGVKLGLVAFILSAFIALPYAVMVSFKNKEGIVPYGPFLISSLIIVFIYMEQFKNMLYYLFNI